MENGEHDHPTTSPYPLETMKHAYMPAFLPCQTTEVRLPCGTSHNENKDQKLSRITCVSNVAVADDQNLQFADTDEPDRNPSGNGNNRQKPEVKTETHEELQDYTFIDEPGDLLHEAVRKQTRNSAASQYGTVGALLPWSSPPVV